MSRALRSYGTASIHYNDVTGEVSVKTDGGLSVEFVSRFDAAESKKEIFTKNGTPSFQPDKWATKDYHDKSIATLPSCSVIFRRA